MPTSDAAEARSAASGATATSGWDANGEYVERSRSGAADGDAACKARWRGIKGLDPECS